MTDRVRPGLVTSYDIQPGNGVGQFLQPRILHGALRIQEVHKVDTGSRHNDLGISKHCLCCSVFIVVPAKLAK